MSACILAKARACCVAQFQPHRMLLQIYNFNATKNQWGDWHEPTGETRYGQYTSQHSLTAYGPGLATAQAEQLLIFEAA